MAPAPQQRRLHRFVCNSGPGSGDLLAALTTLWASEKDPSVVVQRIEIRPDLAQSRPNSPKSGRTRPKFTHLGVQDADYGDPPWRDRSSMSLSLTRKMALRAQHWAIFRFTCANFERGADPVVPTVGEARKKLSRCPKWRSVEAARRNLPARKFTRIHCAGSHAATGRLLPRRPRQLGGQTCKPGRNARCAACDTTPGASPPAAHCRRGRAGPSRTHDGPHRRLHWRLHGLPGGLDRPGH